MEGVEAEGSVEAAQRSTPGGSSKCPLGHFCEAEVGG